MPVPLPKVLILCGSWPPDPCGVGDYSDRLCKALNATDKMECIPWPGPGKNSSRDRRLYGIFRVRALARQIVELAPDIVHIQYPSVGYGRSLGISALPTMLRLTGHRGGIVATIHEYSNAHILRRLAVGPLVRRVDLVITPSHQERDVLLRKFGSLSRGNLDVIPVGPVAPEGFAKDRTPDATVRNPAFYGFINRSKGFEVLLDALAILRDNNESVFLKVVGKFEPDRNRYHASLKRRIDDLALTELIEFRGHLDLNEAFGELSRSGFLVFPFPDGFSYRRSSLISTLPLGKPVLTTFPRSTEGMGDLNRYMLMVKPRDARALADGIGRLNNSKTLRQNLSEGSLQLAEEFSFERAATRHLALYEKLLGRLK